MFFVLFVVFHSSFCLFLHVCCSTCMKMVLMRMVKCICDLERLVARSVARQLGTLSRLNLAVSNEYLGESLVSSEVVDL